MLPLPDPRQLKTEADRISRNDAPKKLPGLIIVPRDETIAHQPRDLYRPAHFLAKTATPQEVADLGEILSELWALNEEHMGENTLETEVYYTVTGEDRGLAGRVMEWCRSYFGHRADPRRVSPQEHSDPFELFKKLLREYEAILGGLGTREQSINYVFLHLPMRYVYWLLYDWLWKDAIEQFGERLFVRYWPAHADTPERMGRFLAWGGWLEDHLGRFLHRVRLSATPQRLNALDREADHDLRARLSGMAADIQEMRRFLVQSFNPRKTALILSADFAVGWRWCVRFGIANVVVATPADQIIPNLEAHQTDLAVAVNYDGLLFDARMPWVTAASVGPVDGVNPLALNCYLLELFHERLLSFYAQIDFQRIRSRARSQIVEETSEGEVVALSCQDLATGDSGTEAEEVAPYTAGRRIAALRCQQLLAVLASAFGCEVRQGKGSEVTVYRPGGKKFTLGHHTRNPLVPSVVVGQLLKRLRIALPEWLSVVYG